MKFLKKYKDSNLSTLRYSHVKERTRLRQGLLAEQFGFCAYSERFIKNSDSCHIEHFYPQNEFPQKSDDYFNLYAVLSWVNENKPKKIKDKYLPILEPFSSDLAKRIKYEHGMFIATSVGDKAAQNLINFLGLNKIELFEDRRKHLSRIKQLRQWYDKDDFLAYLKEHREELSFATAIEKEFDIDILALLV